MIIFTQQVLTTLGWIVLALAVSPMVWLLFQPYFKGLSSAERRAAHLLRDMLTVEHTLRQPWPTLDLLRPRPTHKLPVVLSVDEVWHILAHIQVADRDDHD